MRRPFLREFLRAGRLAGFERTGFRPGKGSILYRILYRTLAAGLLLGGTLASGAQTHDLTAWSDDGATVAGTPVAASAEPQHPASEFQPLAARRWEFGPFVNYGNGLTDRTDFHFFALGFQAGRMMSPVIHAGPLSGRFELGANVTPLFQAYTPAAQDETVPAGDGTITQRVAGGTYTGERDTGGFPLELRDCFAPVFAMVSGSGRGALYHAQVSANG